MKKIWVICATVDLGYHMVKGYDSYDKAKAEFDWMEAEAIEEKIKHMMASPYYTLQKATESAKQYSYYTLEKATELAKKYSYYELESVEVEE